MLVDLGILTFFFITIQILAALKLSTMLFQAKVSRLKTSLTLALLWIVCICVIAGCSLRDMDWPSREVLDSHFFTALNAEREIN